MKNQKIIKISTSSILAFFVSYIIGFIIVFTLNHFGKFSYIADQTGVNNENSFIAYVPVTNQIADLYYTSFFDSKILIRYPGYQIADIQQKEGDFHIYSNKVQYYTNATIKDYLYILLIGSILFLAYIFFTKFKITLT